MRLLAAIVAALAVLWGGYWFVGAQAVEFGMQRWLTQAGRDGLRIGYSGLETRGFPNRFDTTIENIELEHARSGTGWSAPFLQIFALSYRPNHVIAVWPDSQRLRLPGRTLALASEDMRGSLVFEPGAALTLERARLSVTNLELRDEQEPGLPVGAALRAADISRVFLATRQTPAAPFTHDVALELAGIDLSPDLLDRLDPAGALPATINGARLDAGLRFDGPVGARIAPARLTGVDLRKAILRWGDASLSVSGELRADAAGYAEGTLSLKAENWRQVFRLLATAGLVKPAWEGALEPLASADGTPDALNTTLRYEAGQTYFGPLSLGPAPRLN